MQVHYTPLRDKWIKYISRNYLLSQIKRLLMYQVIVTRVIYHRANFVAITKNYFIVNHPVHPFITCVHSQTASDE